MSHLCNLVVGHSNGTFVCHYMCCEQSVWRKKQVAGAVIREAELMYHFLQLLVNC